MSTATVPQRPRPTTEPGRRTPIRLARPPATPPARAPFVIVVLVLLSLGLGTLLLLNTLLAQGSFTLHSLNDQLAALTDREQALQQRASELAAPQRLARRAHELGMVASVNPAFLRADDGKVLGEPVPAVAQVGRTGVIGSGTATTDSEPAPEPDPATPSQSEDENQQNQQSDQQDQFGGDHGKKNNGSNEGGAGR